MDAEWDVSHREWQGSQARLLKCQSRKPKGKNQVIFFTFFVLMLAAQVHTHYNELVLDMRRYEKQRVETQTVGFL